MTTTHQNAQMIPLTQRVVATFTAVTEQMMASMVLIAIAAAIMASVTGHSDVEGKAKNGVRRAASQLERKFVKVNLCAIKSGAVGWERCNGPLS